jgi:hypothetical protein
LRAGASRGGRQHDGTCQQAQECSTGKSHGISPDISAEYARPAFPRQLRAQPTPASTPCGRDGHGGDLMGTSFQRPARVLPLSDGERARRPGRPIRARSSAGTNKRRISLRPRLC